MFVKIAPLGANLTNFSTKSSPLGVNSATFSALGVKSSKNSPNWC